MKPTKRNPFKAVCDALTDGRRVTDAVTEVHMGYRPQTLLFWIVQPAISRADMEF